MHSPLTKEMSYIKETQEMLDAKLDYLMEGLTNALEIAGDLDTMYEKQENHIDQLFDMQAIQLAQWQLILKSLLQLQKEEEEKEEEDYLGESVILEQNRAVVVNDWEDSASYVDDDDNSGDSGFPGESSSNVPHESSEAYSQLLDDLPNQHDVDYTSMWHVLKDGITSCPRLPPITRAAVSLSRSSTPYTSSFSLDRRRKASPTTASRPLKRHHNYPTTETQSKSKVNGGIT